MKFVKKDAMFELREERYLLTKFYKLKDNRYLAISVLEILSYPEAPITLQEKESFNESVLKLFKQALSEMHKLASQSTAYELL